jgi:uronate dehydrogenase
MARSIERLLITGAAGNLGKAMRQRFRGRYPLVRLSDVKPMDAAADGEEVVVCDLADAAAVDALCRDIDAIIHFGGQASEAEWPQVLGPNIVGAINLWEGARKAGTGRVLFASSNHAIGLHRRSSRIDHTAPARPDGRYGLSKAFGEDLASLYAYKFGVRGFCMRIGTCFPEPMNARALSTWLSYADLERLLTVGLTADYVFEIVYGVSRNTRSWWDNSNAYRLGYEPQDDAEVFAEKLAGVVSEDPIEEAFQGGSFVGREFAGDPSRIP